MTAMPKSAKSEIQAKVQSQVIRYALELITEDMAQSLMRTARSVIIKETQDLSCAIFDRQGRVVVQCNHAPMLLAGCAIMLGEALKQLGERGMNDGDVIIANDPFRGGQHIMDVMMIAPVFYEGTHVGYVSCLCHHSDLGGAAAGGVGGGLRDVYSEGLCFPFVKAYIKGEENRDLFDLIAANIRVPTRTLSDMRAQVAACITGIRRYRETIQRFGLATIESAAELLMAETKARLRAGIGKIPDGTYMGEEFVDDDGIGDKPFRVEVKLIKKGDELVIDLTGSDDQAPGNINSPLASTMAAVQYPLTVALDNSVCPNHGMFEALQYKTRKGSIVDPRRPAPCSARSETMLKVQEATFKALAKAMPGKIVASSHGQITHTAFVGTDPKTGHTFVYNEINGGGAGARPTKDARDGQAVHLSRFMNTPTEMIEHEFPVRVREYSYVPDTCGPGQFRGGLAVTREVELLIDKATFSRYCDRHKFRPEGLDGGGSAEPGTLILNPDTEKTKLKSKGANEIKMGDVIKVITPGGGGYGPPAKRDARSIAADLADGKVSEAHVAKHYGAAKLDEAKRILAGARAAAE